MIFEFSACLTTPPSMHMLKKADISLTTKSAVGKTLNIKCTLHNRKWMSFCCLTNTYWSNSKMTTVLYNYNTVYRTKLKHSAEWYDIAINSTMKT